MNVDNINFSLSKLALPIVTIIGPPGSGKTEVGSVLSSDLSWTFLDTDVLIEQAAAETVPEIFTRYGERTFRLMEKRLMEKIGHLYDESAIQGSTNGTVISTGGGLPVLSENLTILTKIGQVITLYASVDVLVERTSKKANRPLLNPAGLSSHEKEYQSRLHLLLEERKQVYAQGCLSIDTSNLTVAAVADLIKKTLKLDFIP